MEFNMQIEIERAIKMKELKIDNIVTPNIINIGQKDRLAEISTGLNQIKLLEKEIQNKWSPKELRKDIWALTLILIGIMTVAVLWCIRKSYARVKKGKGKKTDNNVFTLIQGARVDDGIEEIPDEMEDVASTSEPKVKKQVRFKWHP